nr:hypothetical protein [Bacillus pumilus]
MSKLMDKDDDEQTKRRLDLTRENRKRHHNPQRRMNVNFRQHDQPSIQRSSPE